MLIGLCGGICSGKNAIADYLVQHHRFTRLLLPGKPVTPLAEETEAHSLLSGLAGRSSSPVPRTAKEESFTDINDLLDFVTKRWREHFVTTDIWDEASLDLLLRRPFFLLVSVDAPVSLRWKRFCDKCQAHALSPPSLTSFVLWSDRHLYSPTHPTSTTLGIIPIFSRAHLRLINSSTSLTTLHTSLTALNLADPSRLRPSWDMYFMRLASLASLRSNCMKRRVGAVLIGPSLRVISTGYNGTPRHLTNCNEGGCGRCNGGDGAGTNLSTCLCLHAEENALLEAGRERIREGSTLYCDTCPCLTCAVKIVQVGIGEVVYSLGYNMDLETARIFREGGVKLRQFVPPREGVVNLDAVVGFNNVNGTSIRKDVSRELDALCVGGNDGDNGGTATAATGFLDAALPAPRDLKAILTPENECGLSWPGPETPAPATTTALSSASASTSASAPASLPNSAATMMISGAVPESGTGVKDLIATPANKLK